MVLRRPETSATNGFFFNLFIMSSCLKNMYLMSKYNICISNAQYSSFSAQQNLWCEILEF